MLGNNLPDTDEWTLSLLTNDEVLAVNQDALGSPGRRVTQTKGTEIWVKALNDGSKAIGLFNRTSAATEVELSWTDAGLTGRHTLRDLWAHKDLGAFKTKYSVQVPAHGAVLLRALRWRADRLRAISFFRPVSIATRANCSSTN
jgi:alpha-galactosidase